MKSQKDTNADEGVSVILAILKGLLIGAVFSLGYYLGGLS
jgi:hypothetical protein